MGLQCSDANNRFSTNHKKGDKMDEGSILLICIDRNLCLNLRCQCTTEADFELKNTILILLLLVEDPASKIDVLRVGEEAVPLSKVPLGEARDSVPVAASPTHMMVVVEGAGMDVAVQKIPSVVDAVVAVVEGVDMVITLLDSPDHPVRSRLQKLHQAPYYCVRMYFRLTSTSRPTNMRWNLTLRSTSPKTATSVKAS